jgi:hypothetical protein
MKCVSVESVSGPRSEHWTGSSGYKARVLTSYCEWLSGEEKCSSIFGHHRDASVRENLEWRRSYSQEVNDTQNVSERVVMIYGWYRRNHV